MTHNVLIRQILVALILTLWGNTHAQLHTQAGRTWADSVVNVIQHDQFLDAGTKSSLADSVFQIYSREHDTCQQINIRVLQATHLDRLGKSDSALTQLYWANHAFHKGCDSLLLMSLYRNLTNVYLSLGELNRIDSISKIALGLWNSQWKEKDTRLAILSNLAISQAQRNNVNGANVTFRQVYYEANQDSNADYIQKTLINLGSLKGMTGDLDSAYFFFSSAASSAKEQDDMDNYLSLLINLANLDGQRGKNDQAIIMLDSAYILAESLKSTEKLAKVQRVRAELFANLHQYDKAYNYLKSFIDIREKYLNEERVKVVNDMMEKYESEKKARQIQQLQLDKLDATLTNERVRNTRNRYLYIGIGVLILAVALSSRLRYVHKSRVAIQKEKDVSEGLLLNILPASVADELKKKGYAEAMQYDVATILFSDFKEFTTISELLSPAQLVEEINACFKVFDEIITRFKLEKIKTIGDAYMAAGGLPDPQAATALEVVLAGLQMQQFIIARKKVRDAQQLPAFEMRIGIHSGPVVAGIVGVKKFQYDIWGDTVNIANRMESSSEVGRVNISEVTYQLVKDNPGLEFTTRGMIHAKGKGEMEMYFVDQIKPQASPQSISA
ncbi:MAG: adenylate/guanylate cyclase domain-containing protein [Saprospiraceae bacterium]